MGDMTHDDRRMLQETHDTVIRLSEQMAGPTGVIVRVGVLEKEAEAQKNFRWKVLATCGAIAMMTGPIGMKLYEILFVQHPVK